MIRVSPRWEPRVRLAGELLAYVVFGFGFVVASSAVGLGVWLAVR